MQAMIDGLSLSKNAEALYHKHEAIRWLTGNSKDFVQVCLFAGMDPDYVRKKAKKSLLSPVAWRAAPGQGKRYLERKAYRQKKPQEPPKVPDSETSARESANILTGPWQA